MRPTQCFFGRKAGEYRVFDTMERVLIHPFKPLLGIGFEQADRAEARAVALAALVNACLHNHRQERRAEEKVEPLSSICARQLQHVSSPHYFVGQNTPVGIVFPAWFLQTGRVHSQLPVPSIVCFLAPLNVSLVL